MPHTFDLSTMDGEGTDMLDLSETMEVWLDEQGITRAEVEINHRLGATFGNEHYLRVTIEDVDHAMWFKMRWSPDVTAHTLRLQAENERMHKTFAMPSGSGGTLRFLPDPNPPQSSEWHTIKTVRPDGTPPRLDGFAELQPVASEYRRPVRFGRVTHADGTVGTLTPETQKRIAKKIEALLTQEMIDALRG